MSARRLLKSWFSRLALGLSVLVLVRIYRFLLHFADLYMGVQVLCRPPDVGPPTSQQLCIAKRACAAQNGTDLVQADKHDLIMVSIKMLKEMSCACFSAHETPNTTPVQVRAFTEHQTLRLCKFERSRTTKHYTCAGFGAREQPNTTPVQV